MTLAADRCCGAPCCPSLHGARVLGLLLSCSQKQSISMRPVDTPPPSLRGNFVLLALSSLARSAGIMPATARATKKAVVKKAVTKKPATKTIKKSAAKKPATPKKSASKKPAAAKKAVASPGKKMMYAPERGSDVDIAARLKATIAILNDKPGSALKTQAAVVVLEGVLKVL